MRLPSNSRIRTVYGMLTIAILTAVWVFVLLRLWESSRVCFDYSPTGARRCGPDEEGWALAFGTALAIGPTLISVGLHLLAPPLQRVSVEMWPPAVLWIWTAPALWISTKRVGVHCPDPSVCGPTGTDGLTWQGVAGPVLLVAAPALMAVLAFRRPDRGFGIFLSVMALLMSGLVAVVL